MEVLWPTLPVEVFMCQILPSNLLQRLLLTLHSFFIILIFLVKYNLQQILQVFQVVSLLLILILGQLILVLVINIVSSPDMLHSWTSPFTNLRKYQMAVPTNLSCWFMTFKSFYNHLQYFIYFIIRVESSFLFM